MKLYLLKNKKYELIFLILLFLCMRLYILQTRVLPTYPAELYIGTIAKDIQFGLSMPLLDYPIVAHEGGALVSGILTILFFTIFGDSYFSLKLVALTFSFGAFVFYLLLLYRHFDYRVGRIGGLLYIFPPSLFAESSLCLIGTHCESNFFSAFTTLIFYEIFFSRKKYYTQNTIGLHVMFFLFGLVSGFSLYFAFISIPTLITCLLFWFVFDKIFFCRKQFLIFLSSFLAGYSPGIYYNLTHGFKGYGILSYGGYKEVVGKVDKVEKFLNFFSFDLPYLFDFYEIELLYIPVISFFCYLILFAAFFFILWHEKESLSKIMRGLIPSESCKVSPNEISKEIYFLIYPIIFCLIYFFSNLYTYSDLEHRFISFRYFLPLFPFIVIILSFFFSRLMQKKSKSGNLLGIFFFVAFLSIGLIGNIKIPLLTDGITYKNFDGFSYERFSIEITNRYKKDLQKCITIGNKVNPDFRHQFFLGFGDVLGGRIKSDLIKGSDYNFKEMEKVINGVPEKYRAYFFEGLGYSIGGYPLADYENHISLLERADEKDRGYCYIGVSKGLMENLLLLKDFPVPINKIEMESRKYFYPLLGRIVLKEKDNLKDAVNSIEELSADEKIYIYRGLSRGIFSKADYQMDKFVEMMKLVPHKYRAVCFDEMGMLLGSFYKRNLKKVESIIEGLNSDTKVFAYKGVGRSIGERFGFNVKGCGETIKKLEAKYQTYCYEGLGEQIAWRVGENRKVINLILKDIDPKFKTFVEGGLQEELKYSMEL